MVSGVRRKLFGDRPEALKARGRSGAAKEARYSGPYRKTGG